MILHTITVNLLPLFLIPFQYYFFFVLSPLPLTIPFSFHFLHFLQLFLFSCLFFLSYTSHYTFPPNLLVSSFSLLSFTESYLSSCLNPLFKTSKLTLSIHFAFRFFHMTLYLSRTVLYHFSAQSFPLSTFFIAGFAFLFQRLEIVFPRFWFSFPSSYRMILFH